jgi:hypothetical protein
LAQSEPAISLDFSHLDEMVGQGYQGQEMGGDIRLGSMEEVRSIRSPKRELRRKTLHLDIPTKHIGHTRVVEDEEPLPLPLPLSLELGFSYPLLGSRIDGRRHVRGEEEERGRSRRGSSGGGRSTVQERAVLLAPPRESIHAPSFYQTN